MPIALHYWAEKCLEQWFEKKIKPFTPKTTFEALSTQPKNQWSLSGYKELKLTRKQFKGTYSTLCGPLYFLGLKSSFDFFFLLALHISFHFSSLIFSFCWAFSIHDLSGVILMGKVLRKDFRILGLNWRKASSLYIALPNFTLQLYKVFAKF